MTSLGAILLGREDSRWPHRLEERLGEAAPSVLHAIGPTSLLGARKTALFCSAETPGDAILRAHDFARRLRERGATVISGFQSPLEKECLEILLRGKQPLILCPARSVETMRIPSACRTAFADGRLLILSPFVRGPARATAELALRRNHLVAALADEALIPHVTPGGQTEKIVELLKGWGVPIWTAA